MDYKDYYDEYYKSIFSKYAAPGSHQDALNKTGFWGKQGAGCLFVADDSKRLMLAYRSKDVQQPHTWGVWGGAIDKNEKPEAAVRREVFEETGYVGHLYLHPLAVYTHGDFKYHNFLGVVSREFRPKLDWETEDYEWVRYGEWPEPLHFGLKYLLEKSGKEIEKIIFGS